MHQLGTNVSREINCRINDICNQKIFGENSRVQPAVETGMILICHSETAVTQNLQGFPKGQFGDAIHIPWQDIKKLYCKTSWLFPGKLAVSSLT